MEFDLDFIKEKFDGALASFGKKDDDLIKVKGKEVKELSDTERGLGGFGSTGNK